MKYKLDEVMIGCSTWRDLIIINTLANRHLDTIHREISEEKFDELNEVLARFSALINGAIDKDNNNLEDYDLFAPEVMIDW